jgi:hypothetical protein
MDDRAHVTIWLAHRFALVILPPLFRPEVDNARHKNQERDERRVKVRRMRGGKMGAGSEMRESTEKKDRRVEDKGSGGE